MNGLACDLSVVFVTHGDRLGVLKRFLDSIDPYRNADSFEFICVDNGSFPSASEYIHAHHPYVKVLSNVENEGTSRAYNAGIRLAKGRYVLIVNDDTVMPEGMLEKLKLHISQNPECEGIALGLKADTGSFQAIRLKIVNISKEHPKNKKRATFIGTGNLLIKKTIIEQIGLYDESYFAGNEDMDLSYRLKRAGVRIYYYPQYYIYHLHVYRNRKTHWAEFLLARRLSDVYFAQKFFPACTFITRWYALQNFRKRTSTVIDAATFKKAKSILYSSRETYYDIQKSLIKNGIEITYDRYIISS